jgi:hypothetical protein
LEADLEELNNDYRLLKKLKRGKITEKEFDEMMGINTIWDGIDNSATVSCDDTTQKSDNKTNMTTQNVNKDDVGAITNTKRDFHASSIKKKNDNYVSNNIQHSLTTKKKKKCRKTKKKPIIAQ